MKKKKAIFAGAIGAVVILGGLAWFGVWKWKGNFGHNFRTPQVSSGREAHKNNIKRKKKGPMREMSAEELSRRALSHTYTLERCIGGVTDSDASPGVWLKNTDEASEVLMTPEEIAAYNTALRKVKDCGLYDLQNAPEEISADTVQRQIEQYTFDSCGFLDGEVFTDELKEMLNRKRNLTALPKDTVKVQYALTANAAEVRAYPSVATLMKEKEDWEFDYFQESMLDIGEGVLVLHQTSDGVWSFVQASDYAGWVRTELLCFCSRDEWKKYLEDSEFVVVMAPRTVTIDGESLHFSMGTRLPGTIDGYGNPKVQLPVAGNTFKTTDCQLKDIPCHEGYLPYTSALVLDQAMKLLNISYGWGQREYLLDCSSMILSVYACFGFELPRNTSSMAKIPLSVQDVSAMNAQEKTKILEKSLPGSLLVMKGHVMMYLGVRDGEVYVLHEFSKYYGKDGSKNRVMQCCITPASIRLSTGAAFLDGVYEIAEILPE